MNSLFLTFGLLTPALSPTPAAPRVDPVASRGAVAAAQPNPDDKSIFGEPLYVNGKRVSDEEIKRFLIYGPCGNMLELARLTLIADDQLGLMAVEAAEAAVKQPATAAAQAEVEKREAPARAAAEATIQQRESATPFATPEERQQAFEAELKKELAKVWPNEGERQKLYDTVFKREYDKLFKSPDALKKALEAEIIKQKSLLHEKLDVSDAEVEKEFDATIAEFKVRYPVLDVPAEISRAYRTVDWYRKDLRTMLYFDRVFLPPNPEEWPIVTREAVRADSGDILVEDAKQSYESRRKVVEKTGGPLPKEDVIYTNMMRQIVRDAVYGLVDFKTAGDGIAPDLVLWADTNGDGKPELTITIDEMWSKVSDTVLAQEIADAKQWFVTSMATADRLQADGHLLSPQDCAKAFAGMVKQYGGQAFNLEQMATKTLYFPSLETYRQYYGLMEGDRKSVV